jgi:hypothetical protein
MSLKRKVYISSSSEDDVSSSASSTESDSTLSLEEEKIIYHGFLKCQAIKNINNLPCDNKHYYQQNNHYLCGIHSNKNNRTNLPKDKNKSKNKLNNIVSHKKNVDASLRERRPKGKLVTKNNLLLGKKGDIVCYKME